MIDTIEQLKKIALDKTPIVLSRIGSLKTTLKGGIITLGGYQISSKIKILASAKDLFDESIPEQLHRAVSFYGSDTFYLIKVQTNKEGNINVRATRVPTLKKRTREFEYIHKEGQLINTEIAHIYGSDIWTKTNGILIHVKKPYNSHRVWSIGDQLTVQVSFKDKNFPISGKMASRHLKLDAVSSDLILGKELKGVIVSAKPYGVFVKVSPSLSILNDVPEPHIIDGVIIGREVVTKLDRITNGKYHGIIVRQLSDDEEALDNK